MGFPAQPASGGARPPRHQAHICVERWEKADLRERSQSHSRRTRCEGGGAQASYSALPYAKRVAQLSKREHHEIVVRPDVVSLLPQLLWHMDDRIADTAFIPAYLASEFARRDVTVILSGVGGDALF